MKDYLERMVASIGRVIKLQQQAIEFLVQPTSPSLQSFIEIASHSRGNASELPRRMKLEISSSSSNEIILFNSLAQERIEIATVSVSSSSVKIIDADGNEVKMQVNNVFRSATGEVAHDEFEVIFIARLPALSLTTFRVIHAENANALCSYNEIKNLDAENGDIELNVSRVKLTIDKATGSVELLTAINGLENRAPFTIGFGAYNTSVKNSGAYLFKPDTTAPERSVFANDGASKIIVINGPLASYVKVIYGTLLVHTIRVLRSETHLDEGVFIENLVNMEKKHSNMEMFMRIKTAIKNDNEFYTDLNGFQWQRRKRVSKLGIEGNYYPITVGAFIQDHQQRMTLTTSHAQGATSPFPGTLEVMLDRRTPVDDERGMEEGVTDNLPNVQQHWLTFEKLESHPEHYQVPSIHAHNLMQISNYPVNVYTSNNKDIRVAPRVKLLKEPLPCDLHLFNLRTLGADDSQSTPSQSTLLIAHRINYNCEHDNLNAFYSEICGRNAERFDNVEIFSDLEVKSVESMSLTALKSHGSISSFRAAPIEAMELKTFNVTFV
jgi:alpha-mannosidase